ncbi:MAG: helix-turn-helix domain-containing protein, partial [Hyphomicrobiales bacterium]|nr:helix-turn-helix domain-containing protein [Hyphomicrobiales bacterium]
MTTQTEAIEAAAGLPGGEPASLANGVRDIIRRHMEGAGLGVSALARKAGIGHGTMIDFMNGKTDSLRLDNMAAVADALDLSLGELLGELVTAHAD